MTLKTRLTTLLLTCITITTTLRPAPAHAGGDPITLPFVTSTILVEEFAPEFSLTTTATPVVLAGLLSLTSVVATTGGLTATQAGQAIALEDYLDARPHQVEEALALGAGPVVDDLSFMLALHTDAQHKRLGQALRRHREAFAALLRAERSPQRAQALLAMLHKLEASVRAQP